MCSSDLKACSPWAVHRGTSEGAQDRGGEGEDAAGEGQVSRHTPGPWRTANGKGVASVKAADCAIYINVRTVETDECVARWQADARLIATTPDLLDVLSRLADFPFSHQGPAEGPLAYILNEARAVIAKAEGK